MYTITARTLADIRQRVWTREQTQILDILIEALATEYVQANPRFDEDVFKYQSQYLYL